MELVNTMGIASLIEPATTLPPLPERSSSQPKVILADEPTAALDTENGKNVMDLSKKLAIDNHSAILVVTHDQRMVEGFDLIFHVSDGRIAA